MKLLTTEETAAALGVSERQIRNILKKYGIPGAQKIGRDWVIPAEALGRPPLEYQRPKPGPKPKN